MLIYFTLHIYYIEVHIHDTIDLSLQKNRNEMNKCKLMTLAVALLLLASCSNKQNDTTEITDSDTITQAELCKWRNSHFGMFVHFGVYSELGGVWQGKQIPYYAEQIMNHARIPIDDYEEVARQFNPTEWNADSIVLLAKTAGMKYIVFTTKHHDGFCMFKTQTTDYNIVDFTSFGRDVLAELAAACKRHDMKLGLYYSLPDWHFPQGIARMDPDTTTDCTEFVNQVYSPLEIITPELEDYIVSQLAELLTNYGEIETIWFDMGLPTAEQSRRFRETVKSIQPQCLINGRIMNNCGDYLTLPDNGEVVGYTDAFWDNPASFYGSWGFKSWIARPETEQQIEKQLDKLFSTVSHGGVFLLNIGPKGDGSILDYEKSILRGIGSYLANYPDTLDNIVVKQSESEIISENDNLFILNDENGLTHAAFDATTYMTTEANSWKSWRIAVSEAADYDIFIEYLPENDAKQYLFVCGNQKIARILPGVDRMYQTAYIGKMHFEKGEHDFILEQAEKNNPLESIGLKLKRIALRKS